jgi:endonuclease YncB( thermonuclease family)
MSKCMYASALLASFVLSVPMHTLASPIEPGAVEILDGDTIKAGGKTIRLVGVDTPEMGSRAKCESERTLGAAASRRLRELVAGGGLDLEQVPCACQPGTEGTPACNHGRSCGTLKARGQDVGAILIGEGLARPFVCGAQSCPTRQGWCGANEAKEFRYECKITSPLPYTAIIEGGSKHKATFYMSHMAHAKVPAEYVFSPDRSLLVVVVRLPTPETMNTVIRDIYVISTGTGDVLRLLDSAIHSEPSLSQWSGTCTKTEGGTTK